MNWYAFLEAVILAGVWVGAVTFTLFVLTYGFWAKWRRVASGRAVMVSSLASALLLDLTLLLRSVEVSPLTALAITAGVVALIALGGTLKLGALLHEIVKSRRKP